MAKENENATALEFLTQLIGGKAVQASNVEIVRTGDKIILPPEMTYDDGIKWLERKKKEEEKVVAVYHEMPFHPLDGAVAFHKALAALYGWTDLVPTPGFWSDTPPHQIGVVTGPKPKDRLQVPWGRVTVPKISGFLNTGLKTAPLPCFTLNGEVKAKSLPEVERIVQKTLEILNTESIYRGAALKIGFKWRRTKGAEYDSMSDCPRFWDIDGVKEDDLVLSDLTGSALKIGLFTPIEYPAACRQFGIPLKRGVIMSGKYGTGKTLTAAVTAIKAVRSKWTFIYLDSVDDLEDGLKMAAQYGPAVVFAEDIDQLMMGDRSKQMNDVLNIIDGVDTKGCEIITVLTTNHIEKLNPAFLRPGRIDSLIEVTPPDAKAAERLIRKYGRDLFAVNTDLGPAGKKLEGRIPAVIREAVERSKIAAVTRMNGGDITGEVLVEDVLDAADAMAAHINMLDPEATQTMLPANTRVMLEVPTEGAGREAVMRHLGATPGDKALATANGKK
jgi:transitional endoplasmic reticulum ATPase